MNIYVCVFTWHAIALRSRESGYNSMKTGSASEPEPEGLVAGLQKNATMICMEKPQNCTSLANLVNRLGRLMVEGGDKFPHRHPIWKTEE